MRELFRELFRELARDKVALFLVLNCVFGVLVMVFLAVWPYL